MTNIHDYESERVEIEQALEQWMMSLDRGDVEGLVTCCDPEIIIANERQPTKFGLQAIRDKYEPRLEKFSTKSTIEIEKLLFHNDIAIVITQWTVKSTDKQSGQTNESGGRLLLNYRRNQHGEWKILVDMDNNDA